jgi:hypothetical protein
VPVRKGLPRAAARAPRGRRPPSPGPPACSGTESAAAAAAAAAAMSNEPASGPAPLRGRVAGTETILPRSAGHCPECSGRQHSTHTQGTSPRRMAPARTRPRAGGRRPGVRIHVRVDSARRLQRTKEAAWAGDLSGGGAEALSRSIKQAAPAHRLQYTAEAARAGRNRLAPLYRAAERRRRRGLTDADAGRAGPGLAAPA